VGKKKTKKTTTISQGDTDQKDVSSLGGKESLEPNPVKSTGLGAESSTLRGKSSQPRNRLTRAEANVKGNKSQD